MPDDILVSKCVSSFFFFHILFHTLLFFFTLVKVSQTQHGAWNVCLKNIDVHLQHILLNVLMNKAGVVGDRFPVIDLPSLFECLIVSLSLVLHVSLNNMVYSVCMLCLNKFHLHNTGVYRKFCCFYYIL